MKRFFKKLKSRAGESIAEVLIALLVSSIGLVMLASMISTSGSIIKKSRDALEHYYEDANWSNANGEVTIAIAEAGEVEIKPTVTFYTGTLGTKDVVYYIPGG